MRIFYIILSCFVIISTYANDNNLNKNINNKHVRNYIKKGNEEYRQKHYGEAETYYKLALQDDPNSEIAQYNLALSLLKQNPIVEDSSSNSDENVDSNSDKKSYDPLYLFEQISKSNNKNLAEKSLICLGNAYFNKKDYKASIDYYKRALRLNPDDVITRKNLRAAQLMLPPDQPNDQNQNQNQDQNQDQDQKDNNQKDKNNQNDQNNQNKDQNKNQNKNKNDGQSDNKQSNQKPEDKQGQGGRRSENSSMSKENIEKILQSAQRQEDKTRQKVEKEKQGNTTRTTNRPW